MLLRIRALLVSAWGLSAPGNESVILVLVGFFLDSLLCHLSIVSWTLTCLGRFRCVRGGEKGGEDRHIGSRNLNSSRECCMCLIPLINIMFSTFLVTPLLSVLLLYSEIVRDSDPVGAGCTFCGL